MTSFNIDEIDGLELDTATPTQILTWALGRFGNRLVIASSFGLEDVCLIHMATEIDPAVRVFSLDTGRLHQETYDLMDRATNRYDLNLEILFPEASAVESMVREAGINLFYDSVENRKRCCGVRKVVQLQRVLADADAWVTGLRRDQNVTRQDVPVVEIDEAHGGIVKVNPLAAWSTEQVWAYVREHRVPYNVLHDQGFPSIGCEPCSRPVKDGEDARAGRWWWENPETRECGLHRES